MASVLALACETANEVEHFDGDLSQPERITNGYTTSATFDVVAIYRDAPGVVWPCSGTLLRDDGWVLTACHCVTYDGADSGTGADPMPVSIIKVSPTSTVNPGVTVPLNALPVTAMHLHPTLDLALVKAPGLQVTHHTSLWMGPADALEDYAFLHAFGYGISQGISGTIGAGTLRYAMLPVRWSYTERYALDENTAGQYLNHGDSGGPSILWDSFPSGEYYWYLTGVHDWISPTGDGSWYGVDVNIAGRGVAWMQTKIGWVYIFRSLNSTQPELTQYMDVAGNSSAEKATVWMWNYTGTGAQKWYYNPDDKLIFNSNQKCLTIAYDSNLNGAGLWMETCTGKSSQRWYFGGDLTIRNQNGKCITAPSIYNSGSLLGMNTCNGSELQRWAVSFQPPVQ